MSALLTRHAESSQSTSMVPQKSWDPSLKKRSKLLSFMVIDKSTSHINQGNESQEYLCDICIPEDGDPPMVAVPGGHLPNSSQASQALFSYHSFSASVERLFSISDEVFRPVRCHLLDSTFESMMFLYIWCYQHV